MGFVFFLLLWPVVLVFGVFALVLPYIPYITLIHGAIWLGIGLLLRYIFNKHQLFKKGLSHKKAWIRIITDLARWAIRIDIVANIVLIICAIILAVIFATKGITPFLFL